MKIKALTELANMDGGDVIDWIIENQYDYALVYLGKKNKNQFEDIVKDIMQEGFEIAMGGNINLSEEVNRKEQTARYDRAVKNYSFILRSLL